MAVKGKKGMEAVPADDWAVREDFRTLCEAKKIERDPKRMVRVQEYAKSMMMDAAAIACDDEGEE